VKILILNNELIFKGLNKDLTFTVSAVKFPLKIFTLCDLVPDNSLTRCPRLANSSPNSYATFVGPPYSPISEVRVKTCSIEKVGFGGIRAVVSWCLSSKGFWVREVYD